jgi:hypothetical protein
MYTSNYINHIHTSKQELREISSRGITLSKIIELDLPISEMYPYMKFELNMCNPCRDNEWKLNDDGMTEQGNTICPCHFMEGT